MQRSPLYHSEVEVLQTYGIERQVRRDTDTPHIAEVQWDHSHSGPPKN